MRTLFVTLIFTLALLGCNDDNSISSSGGGSLSGDGGETSAQFSGSYKGRLSVKYSGDGVDGSDDLPVTIVINTNGTLSLTIEKQTVGGVINGNQLEIVLKLSRTEDGVECNANFIINAKVQGLTITGPIKGDAKCKALLQSRKANLSGTLSVKKV